VIANLQRMLAVELTCAARGIELRAPLEPARGTGAAVAALREVVAGAGPDRWLAPELSRAADAIGSGAILTAVTNVVGELR
jgi:histidine ammonia-lyase